MMTGAMFGIGFAFLARRLTRTALVPAGAMYGLAVFVVSALIGLPVAAKITGSRDHDLGHGQHGRLGDVRDRARDVRPRARCLALRTAPVNGEAAVAVGARSAMLSR